MHRVAILFFHGCAEFNSPILSEAFLSAKRFSSLWMGTGFFSLLLYRWNITRKMFALFMQWKGRETMLKWLQSVLKGSFIVRTEKHQRWNHFRMNYGVSRREYEWNDWNLLFKLVGAWTFMGIILTSKR